MHAIEGFFLDSSVLGLVEVALGGALEDDEKLARLVKPLVSCVAAHLSERRP